MIVTTKKDLAHILKALDNSSSVFIIGCGSCATACKTGGEHEIQELSDALTAHGKTITGSVVVPETCHEMLVRKETRPHKDALAASDSLVVLACGSGVQAVSRVFDRTPIAGCSTRFLATTVRAGRFSQSCIQCGDCVVDQFEGLCPLSRCPKGILNGPCGGMDGGKCEIDQERDCVFALIYEKRTQAQAKPELTYMKPKDYSTSRKTKDINV